MVVIGAGELDFLSIAEWSGKNQLTWLLKSNSISAAWLTDSHWEIGIRKGFNADVFHYYQLQHLPLTSLPKY